VWPWLVGVNAGTRTTVVSSPISTPCCIWQIFASFGQPASGAGGLSLLYSTDDSGEQTSGPVVKPSGTPIFDPIDFRSSTVTEADEIPEHLPMVGEGGTVSLPFVITPKYIIDVAGPIFLKWTLRGGPGEIRIRGMVMIFEASSLDQLANFL